MGSEGEAATLETTVMASFQNCEAEKK